jgi:hypothetical protein
VHGRLVVLVQAGLRDPQILAVDGSDFLDHVVDGALVPGAGHHFQVAWNVAVVLLEQVFLRGRARLNQLELEDRGLPHDLLGARDVADARHLHEDLIRLLPRDARLGDSPAR